MDRILVHPSGWGFMEEASAKPFTPWGCNYYDPFTGWAPQLWTQFDPARVAEQLSQVAELGANSIRVFLTLKSLLERPGKASEKGIEKVMQMLDLAARHQLRVIWSGPSLWEGVPDWWPAGSHAQMLIHPDLIADQEAVWKALAGAMRGHPALLAYDLHNEPLIPWQASPIFNDLWRQWKARYAPNAPEDPPLPAPPTYFNWDWDVQRFRETLAVAYVERMSAAIRGADDTHLITIGLHQKSAPFDWYPPDGYAAFNACQLAPYLDYLSVHFYPHHIFHPNLYRDPYETSEAMAETLLHARAVMRTISAAGKPVVLQECGWYGGGAVFTAGREQPERTEADQTLWCRSLVEATRGDVCGWLFWPYRDTPSSLDPSRFSGLYAADGKRKDWGRTFAQLAPEMTAAIPPRQPGTRRIQMERKSLVTDPQAVKDFRKAYLRAFQNGEVLDFGDDPCEGSDT